MVDVSTMHANSLPQMLGEKQNQSVHTHCISENFRVVHEQKDKNALEMATL